MEAQATIAKAKARLMLENPFFGAIAASMNIIVDDDLQTYSTTPDSITFGQNYLKEHSPRDIEFVLVSSAMHSLLRHNTRAGKRHKNLWQKATDHTINALLHRNGVSLPLEAEYSSEFEGMYSEEVYEKLKDQMSPEELEEDEIIEIAPQKITHDEHLQSEEFIEQLISKMNLQGTLPKDIRKVLPALFSERIDWQEALYRYISSYQKSSFRFMPPNMKYLYRGITLPSLGSELLRIVIAIDTSGSIDDELAQRFLGEVESIMLQFADYEIDLIMADSKIQSHRVYSAGERLDHEITGRGGTDFSVVFEYIEHYIDYPSLLIYFTDGRGKFPQHEPNYDTLWVAPQMIEVPFGDVISLQV